MPLVDPTEQQSQQGAQERPQARLTDPSAQPGFGVPEGDERQRPGFLRRTKEFFTGETPMEFPDAPEFGNLPLKQGGLRIAGILSTTVNEEQQAKGILNTLPGTKLRKDKFGNIMVRVPQKFLPEGEKPRWSYLNIPGFSAQDVLQPAAQVLSFIPAAKVAGAGKTLVGKAALGFGGASATSVAQDAAATGLGTEQGIDPEKAAITGAFGGAAELAGPAIAPIRQAAGRLFRRQPNLVQNGKLTPEGRETLKKTLVDMGVSAQSLSDDVLTRLADDFTAIQAGGKNTAEEALRIAEAEALPVPVRQTRGQVTQDPRIQMSEDLAEKGALGETPQTIMSGARSEADEALRGNVEAIQGRIAGGGARVSGQRLRARGEGPAEVSETLSAQRQAAEKGVSAAYREAEKQGASAGLPVQNVREFVFGLNTAVKGNHNLNGMPSIQGILDDAAEVAGGTGGGVSEGFIPIKRIFDIRRQASNARAAGGEQAVAAGKIVREIDDFMQKSLDDALFAGDAKAIEAWQKAIGARREVGKLYQSGDLVESLTAQAYRGGERALKVDPGDAANYIFGRSDLGFVGRRNLYRDLVGLRKALGGPESDGWNAIREEVFLRFAERGLRGLVGGSSRRFNGTAFNTEWIGAMRKDPRLMRLLFTNAERELISRFGTVAQRITSPVKGGANFSNTTPALVRYMSRLSDAAFLGPRGEALLTRIPGINQVIELAVQAPRTAVNVRGGLTRPGFPEATAGAAAYGGAEGR